MRLSKLQGFDAWIASLRNQNGVREGCIATNGVTEKLWDDGDILRYTTQLFHNAAKCFENWSETLIHDTLYYLIRPGDSNMLSVLTERSLPLSERVGCVRSIELLFNGFFKDRCLPILSYCQSQSSPINSICFMWWDVFPVFVELPHEERDVLDDSCIDVMCTCLGIKNIACQESAVHGLGHWHLFRPMKTRAILDNYLQATPHLPENIVKYVCAARAGKVQ